MKYSSCMAANRLIQIIWQNVFNAEMDILNLMEIVYNVNTLEYNVNIA